MRFESIHISRYGCLSDVSTGDTPLPSIVVVLGPNESGKSTFFDFMSTMLYGFRPATRSQHPYTPWSGGDAEGQARIRLGAGAVQEVHRRLRSTGWSRLQAGGRVDDIRNQPLPSVDHVTRVVFRQVYALTLAQLASLEGESWDLVQDRLVGAMAAPDLRPARLVAEEFEDEANRLWRPDRRGRPRVRELLAELGTLNDLRRRALERDRVLREKVAEKGRAEEVLGALREDRARERERRGVMEYRLNQLLPVRRTLARIEELRARAGAVPELDALPRDPRGRLADLRRGCREAKAWVAELDVRAEGHRVALREYTPGHRDMVEAEAQVRGAANCMASLDDLESAAARAESAVAEVEAQCEDQGRLLFSVPWNEVGRDEIAAVPTARLREAVREYEASRERRRIAQASLRDDESSRLPVALRPGRGRLAVGFVLLLAGAALAALTMPAVGIEIPLDDLIALRAGAASAIAGFILLAMWWDANRRSGIYERSSRSARLRRITRIGVLEAKEVAARSVIAELVGALPVQASLLDAPNLDLPTGIERMSDLLAGREERGRAVADQRDRLGRAQKEVMWLEDTKAVPVQGGCRARAEAVIRSLEVALAAREAAAAAQRDLTRIESADAERDRDAAGAALRALEEQLEGFGDGEADRGAVVAVQRIESRRRADQLRGELEREHQELDEVVAAIREAEEDGETWEWLEDALAAAEGHRDELIRRTEKLQGAIGRLETGIQHLQEDDSVDRTEGRIEAVKERIREAKEGRDRALHACPPRARSGPPLPGRASARPVGTGRRVSPPLHQRPLQQN